MKRERLFGVHGFALPLRPAIDDFLGALEISALGLEG
jgi:hypothetical protein